MRVLLVIVAVIVALGVRWMMLGLTLSQFRGDIALGPVLLASSGVVRADKVAADVERAASKRGYRVVPGTLRVVVSELTTGTLAIAGGGVVLQGNGKDELQRVSIALSFERPSLLWVKTTDKLKIETSAPATSTAGSVFPDDAQGNRAPASGDRLH